MKYWTKNGTIPSTETDGTEGWQEAPMPPASIPEGKELVWLNWSWVVRDPRPEDREGFQWNWHHESNSWVELPLPEVVNENVEYVFPFPDLLRSEP